MKGPSIYWDLAFWGNNITSLLVRGNAVNESVLVYLGKGTQPCFYMGFFWPPWPCSEASLPQTQGTAVGVTHAFANPEDHFCQCSCFCKPTWKTVLAAHGDWGIRKRFKWTGWKCWNDREEVMDGREELKRKAHCIGNGREELKGKGRSNERDEKELKRKERSNEWQGRVATKGWTQWNGRVDRKGR